ncbi:MAG: hypothetical protein ABR610_02240 [Thermoanaerobaculia bacterium]
MTRARPPARIAASLPAPTRTTGQRAGDATPPAARARAAKRRRIAFRRTWKADAARERLSDGRAGQVQAGAHETIVTAPECRRLPLPKRRGGRR